MMKKVMAMLLATSMVLGMTACGSSEAPAQGSGDAQAATAEAPAAAASGETQELVFWGHQEDTWNAAYLEAADAFMAENPDVKIKFEFFPYDEFEAKVQTSLISQEGGADIYEIWGGWGVDYAPTGALKALPDDMAKEIIQDSYEPTTGSLRYGNNLYGLPLEFNIETGGLLVNKNILEANGLDYPKTWDDLKTMGKKVSTWDGDICTMKGFDFVNWDSVPYLLLSMIKSQGGEYLTENDAGVNLVTPEAIKAFEELHDIAANLKTTDLITLTGGGDIEGYQQLFAGECMLATRGVWVIPEAINDFGLEYGKDFDYIECPWYTDQHKWCAETGWAIAINANTKAGDAADRFLAYLYQDDVLLNLNVACAMIPSKKSVSQDPAFLEKMPYAKPLVSILDDASYIGFFNSDRLKEAINNAFVDYCTGVTTSAEDALAAAQAAFDAAQ